MGLLNALQLRRHRVRPDPRRESPRPGDQRQEGRPGHGRRHRVVHPLQPDNPQQLTTGWCKRNDLGLKTPALVRPGNVACQSAIHGKI